MNNCLPALPFTCSNICPATQVFGEPDAGGAVMVVCTGKVAVAPDRSTVFPLNVFLPVKLLSPTSLAEAALRLLMLPCSVVSAPVAREVSETIAAPKVASAAARAAASAATAACACEFAGGNAHGSAAC